MIKVKKIIWNFKGTDFEDCDYEESRKIAVLPRSLKIREEDIDSDACEDDIVDYLQETYGFEVKAVVFEED